MADRQTSTLFINPNIYKHKNWVDRHSMKKLDAQQKSNITFVAYIPTKCVMGY